MKSGLNYSFPVDIGLFNEREHKEAPVQSAYVVYSAKHYWKPAAILMQPVIIQVN